MADALSAAGNHVHRAWCRGRLHQRCTAQRISYGNIPPRDGAVRVQSLTPGHAHLWRAARSAPSRKRRPSTTDRYDKHSPPRRRRQRHRFSLRPSRRPPACAFPCSVAPSATADGARSTSSSPSPAIAPHSHLRRCSALASMRRGCTIVGQSADIVPADRKLLLAARPHRRGGKPLSHLRLHHEQEARFRP